MTAQPIATGPVEVDFDVIREPWNKYELDDGTILKFRPVLLKALKRVDPDGKVGYGFNSQDLITVFNVPPHLKGQPSNRVYSPEDIQANITVEDVRYSTLYEEWGEYALEDGARLRVKSTIIKVSRTSLKDKEGNPVLSVQASHLAELKPPKK